MHIPCISWKPRLEVGCGFVKYKTLRIELRLYGNAMTIFTTEYLPIIWSTLRKSTGSNPVSALPVNRLTKRAVCVMLVFITVARIRRW